MEFKKLKRPAGAYSVSFTANESLAVRSAFKERCFEAAIEEDVAEIPELHINLCNLIPGRSRRLDPEQVDDVAGVLNEFASTTGGHIVEMNEEAYEAVYQNEDILERITLGRTAGQLARQLSTGLMETETSGEISQIVRAHGVTATATS